MSNHNTNPPYKKLGQQLQQLREKLRESVAEVSGAVEIDEDSLVKMEQGVCRPSEEILMLLMSHFNIPDDESVKLWELAGYERQRNQAPGLQDILGDDVKPTVVMVMQTDYRVIYSDMVHATANKHGVVLNFMQSGGPGNQPLTISRVGMSREHAQDLLKLLHNALQAKPRTPRLLVEPESDDQTKST